MTYERSSFSYGSSLLLHGLVVGLILFFTYAMNQEAPKPPKIFELVAGEGDNYAATAAPALGTADGIKVSIPAAPVLAAPEPPPVPAEPMPVAARVTPAKPAPAKPAKKLPDFAHAVERTAARVASRIEAKYKKQLEAEQRKQMTQEQYLKEHPPKAISEEGQGIRQGVVGGSVANKTGGAGGTALTREEGHELEAYWAMLKSKLGENLERPTDVSDTLTARVEFYVGADGSLSNVHISRSSGNAEFDQAVLEAFRRTRSIGPRPDGHGDTHETEFKMHQDDAAP